ncbi:hypothetical protein SH467x_003879 [Pirellulaceae bacterium SH467]
MRLDNAAVVAKRNLTTAAVDCTVILAIDPRGPIDLTMCKLPVSASEWQLAATGGSGYEWGRMVTRREQVVEA